MQESKYQQSKVSLFTWLALTGPPPYNQNALYAIEVNTNIIPPNRNKCNEGIKKVARRKIPR